MRRAGINLINRAFFRHLPQIHHQHAVADILHHIQIMADEHISQAEAFLEVHKQVQHLRFHAFIQRRDRFIQNDQARAERQSAGDIHALALTAG